MQTGKVGPTYIFQLDIYKTKFKGIILSKIIAIFLKVLGNHVINSPRFSLIKKNKP